MRKKFTDYVHPNYLIFAIFLGFLGLLMMFSAYPFARLLGMMFLFLVLLTLIVVSKDISDEKIPLRQK